MKKKITLFLFLLFFSLNAQSIKTNYKISFCGKPQTLSLTEYKDGTVSGFLETDFSKQTEMRSGKSTEIKIRTDITSEQTKRLLTDLNDLGIKSLIDCNTDNQCKSINFLDNSYLNIYLMLEDGSEKKLEYANIYPSSDPNSNIEDTELRKKVQTIVTTVDNVINLNELFRNVSRDLEGGFYYCYIDGISTSCINKKDGNY